MKTVRILALDGGGMRGYLSACFLKRFCQDAMLDPTKLYESFDIITGTSIGGIQALGYAAGKSPDDLLRFFETKGSAIFAYSSLLPLSAYKFNVIMGLPTYPSTFYAQAPLRTALEEVFGTKKLIDLPGKVIIPTWNATDDQSLILSNISDAGSFLEGSDVTAVDAGLSTSAAPLYFPPASALGKTTLDGGVYQNNPVTTAYSVARLLFPSATRYCVLSVGTGVGYTNFVPQVSLTSSFDPDLAQSVETELASVRERLKERYPEHAESLETLLRSSVSFNGVVPYNVDYLFYLMNSVFIPGPQELNARLMSFQTQDLFDDIFFYRFQYPFQEGQDSALDNFSPEQLTKLAGYANTQYEADGALIRNFLSHFTL